MGFFQARVLEWGAIAFSREVIKALKKGDHMDFPGDPMFKTSPSKAESMGFILDKEKAMAPHSSTLAWKNPMDGGAW